MWKRRRGWGACPKYFVWALWKFGHSTRRCFTDIIRLLHCLYRHVRGSVLVIICSCVIRVWPRRNHAMTISLLQDRQDSGCVSPVAFSLSWNANNLVGVSSSNTSVSSLSSCRYCMFVSFVWPVQWLFLKPHFGLSVVCPYLSSWLCYSTLGLHIPELAFFNFNNIIKHKYSQSWKKGEEIFNFLPLIQDIVGRMDTFTNDLLEI